MIESPIGPVRVKVEREAIVEITFGAGPPGGSDPLVDEAERQLRAYFTDRRFAFDIPLAPRGTEFQKKVWRALLEVKPGRTTSYGALADKLGSSARAVGAANGQNPIAIVVPCHRVIGANGDLTGYGGGIERKRWLLLHEGALLA